MGALLAVQQDPEVGPRVDVRRIDPDGLTVRRFRVGRSAQRAEQNAEVAVGVCVIRIERNRAPVRRRRVLEPEPQALSAYSFAVAASN